MQFGIVLHFSQNVQDVGLGQKAGRNQLVFVELAIVGIGHGSTGDFCVSIAGRVSSACIYTPHRRVISAIASKSTDNDDS